ISRQAAAIRRIDNFSLFENQILKTYGFHAVELDNRSLDDQANLFSKADFVLAEHGAGLVNTMFMRPGSTVIEMVPKPMVGRWMYRIMAHQFSLNYFFGSIDVPNGWRWDRDNLFAPAAVYSELLDRIELRSKA